MLQTRPIPPVGESTIPEIKSSTPRVIIGCPLTRGPYWICASASGSYFVYDIKRELNIQTFEERLNSQLGIIEGKKCTFVREHWLLCIIPAGTTSFGNQKAQAGFLNVFASKNFVNFTQWVTDHGLGGKNDSNITGTCSVNNGTNNETNNGSNCTNASANGSYLQILPWYTNVYSSQYNNSNFVAFAGKEPTSNSFRVHTYSLTTGKLIQNTTFENNTLCLEGSDGNINLAIYACIQSDELKIMSTLTGKQISNFTGLRIRELFFGDFSNFIYFGAFGDKYLGQNSRGSYGAIMTQTFTKVVTINSNSSARDVSIQGNTPQNISSLVKYDFVDYCLNFNIYTSKCEFCMPDPYMFDNSTNLCKINASSTQDPRGPNLPGPNSNPVIYLKPKSYEANPGLESATRFTVQLKNLKNSQAFDRQRYIQNMVDKRVIKPMLWELTKTNSSTGVQMNLLKNVTFTPVNNTGALWSEGKVIFQINSNGRDTKKCIFRLSAPDYVKRRLLEDTENEAEEEDSANLLKKSGPSKQSAKSVYDLWKNDGISKLQTLPAYKKAPNYMISLFDILFGLMKLIALGIQIFLVFIRPCMASTTNHILEHKEHTLARFETFNENVDPNFQSPHHNENESLVSFGNEPIPQSRWTAWFASTLLSIQALLILGYLTGNYGGFIDKIMQIGVKHFNTYFWILQPVLNSSFMDRFNQITRGFRLPKFDDSGFLDSPIQQYPLELLIFLISIFIHMMGQLISEKGSKSHGTMKNFRLGTTLAFMYQLLLSSFVCIYKVGGILAFGDLDYFSGRIDFSSPNPTNSTTNATAQASNSGLSSLKAPTSSMSPDQSQENGLDLYGHISLIVSVFVVFYYLYMLLGSIFSFGSNPCYSQSQLQKKTKNLDHLNPEKSKQTKLRIGDKWNFLAFDMDMFSFQEFSISNYLEILSHFVIIFAIVFFSNCSATGPVVVGLMMCLQFVLWSVVEGTRKVEFNREKRKLRSVIKDKLNQIYTNWELERAYKKYSKGKSRALKIIRMEHKCQDKNKTLDTDRILKNFKIDEYGARLDHVSYWKAQSGICRIIYSLLLIYYWLTNASRGLLGCTVTGYLWCFVALLDCLFNILVFRHRTLGDRKVQSLISNSQLVKIHDINAKVEEDSSESNDRHSSGRINRVGSGEISRPLYTDGAEQGLPPVQELNQNLDNENSEDWKVDIEIPNERIHPRPVNNHQSDLKSEREEDPFDGNLPTTERGLLHAHENEHSHPDTHSGHPEHIKNKLSIVGNPSKLPYQAGFVHPSMQHTDDLTSNFTNETYPQNLVVSSRQHQKQLEKLQLENSEKLRSGGILNPLENNKSPYLTVRNGEDEEVSVFQTTVGKENIPETICRHTPLQNDHTSQPEQTRSKSKISYEVASESEIGIYIGGPEALYKKNSKLAPFLSRLNQEDIIVKTKKKGINPEGRTKNYQESRATEPADEESFYSGQEVKNLDQYKFEGDCDTSMDVDFDELDLQISEKLNHEDKRDLAGNEEKNLEIVEFEQGSRLESVNESEDLGENTNKSEQPKNMRDSYGDENTHIGEKQSEHRVETHDSSKKSENENIYESQQSQRTTEEKDSETHGYERGCEEDFWNPHVHVDDGEEEKSFAFSD